MNLLNIIIRKCTFCTSKPCIFVLFVYI
uniref:Uncharacterized protein n=1 Tax=Anguilla anguilla TaxID=7936 RepID=A0A0E9RB22_ANGAN